MSLVTIDKNNPNHADWLSGKVNATAFGNEGLRQNAEVTASSFTQQEPSTYDASFQEPDIKATKYRTVHWDEPTKPSSLPFWPWLQVLGPVAHLSLFPGGSQEKSMLGSAANRRGLCVSKKH